MSDSLPNAFSTILSWLPKWLKPVFAVVFMIALLIAGIWFLKQQFSNGKVSLTCERVVLKGRLLDKNNEEILPNIRVELANSSTMTFDYSEADGTFLLEGVRLPSSNVITLSLTSKDGRNLPAANIDLNNTIKYPKFENCMIDLQTIEISIAKVHPPSNPAATYKPSGDFKQRASSDTSEQKVPLFQGKERIAILPFQFNSSEEKFSWMSEGIPEALTSELSGRINYLFVEALQRDKILKEINFQQTKFVDVQSAVRIGRLLGAHKVMIGSCQLLNGLLEVKSRLINVETGLISHTAEVNGLVDNIFQLQKELAKEWVKKIAIM